MLFSASIDSYMYYDSNIMYAIGVCLCGTLVMLLLGLPVAIGRCLQRTRRASLWGTTANTTAHPSSVCVRVCGGWGLECQGGGKAGPLSLNGRAKAAMSEVYQGPGGLCRACPT